MHNVLLRTSMTLFLVFFAILSRAAEIPSEYLGEGKWVTLKTENGYYLYAIEEDDVVKLGQTQTAPNTTNYAQYCWQIEGDATAGYTFRCLQYENGTKMYITNPTTIATNSQEVLLTSNPSRYYYTEKHQLQLVDNTGMYLAFYSQYYHTIRLHNSADYVGSKMVIGGVNEWSVAAVVYGTETVDGNGLPQGTYLPNGGIVYSGTSYTHGSSLYLADVSNLSIIPIDGYAHSTIKIDNENHYIVAYYIGSQSGITYKNAPNPTEGVNAVTGENKTIWSLDAKNYITNTSGNYTNVPEGKAWQMEMVVQNTNTNTSVTDPSFNQWGSCILSSTSDPLNTYYWGNFQIYQHAPTHSSPNTLNFKSSKGDGLDHIIAQGASVANKNYKVIVRNNGSSVYIVRTIMLDGSLNETQNVYDNVWMSARPQEAISQMSCALPKGINLNSLKISIAEESNLLEGVDYAIQNIGSKDYLTGGGDLAYSAYAGDAAKYQIEWTGIQDLTYSETDGGLHNSFYLKKWNATNSTWEYIQSNENKTPFIYTTSKHVAPITAQNVLETGWVIDGNATWEFDFFANFYVEVAGNANGGMRYRKGSDYANAANGEYIELPSSVSEDQLANTSCVGYSAAVSKQDIRLKVAYTALTDGYYNFTSKSLGTTTLYYFESAKRGSDDKKCLITYKDTPGTLTAWGDDFGDVSKYTIAREADVPVSISGAGYATFYSGIPHTIPSGVTCYIAKLITKKPTDEEVGSIRLYPVTGGVLPANTPVVLKGAQASYTFVERSNAAGAMDCSGNLLSGNMESMPSGSDASTQKQYTLQKPNNEEIGFYLYSGATLGGFKAYLPVGPVPASVRLRGFAFGFDDGDVTGVSEHAASTDAVSIYDLMGRKVQTVSRGLYIVNGKKVFINK